MLKNSFDYIPVLDCKEITVLWISNVTTSVKGVFDWNPSLDFVVTRWMGGSGDSNLFPSSWVERSLHAKFQLDRLPGSGSYLTFSPV